MNTTKQQFRGDMFIIPNGVSKVKNLVGVSSLAKEIKFWFGHDIQPEDEVAHIWVTGTDGKTRDNWSCHGVTREIALNEDFERFPSLIPVKLIENLVENSERGLVGSKFHIILTAAQTKYRYKDAGNFEDCLAKGCSM